MDLSYKIIGGDGREYGPVSLDELRAWVVDGRVGGPTQVWRSDSASWSPATHYDELQPEIGQVEAAAEAVESVGFWPRFGAFLLDCIVMWVVYILVLEPVTFDLAALNTGSPAEALALLKVISKRAVLQYAIEMIYCVTLTGALGATLGKMAINARIVRKDGSKLGFGRALLIIFLV